LPAANARFPFFGLQPYHIDWVLVAPDTFSEGPSDFNVARLKNKSNRLEEHKN
jgi:hypothetical protein